MTSLAEGLVRWAEQQIGRKVTRVDEIPGGASRSSNTLTTEDGQQYYLRVDTGKGAMSGTPFTLEREFATLNHIQGSGLPLARAIGYSQEYRAALISHVPGTMSFRTQSPEHEEKQLRDQLMRAIVDVQKLDVTPMSFLSSGPRDRMAAAIIDDLEVWEGLYNERSTIRDPLLEFACAWLKRSVPDPDARPVLVHGDMGPGNFLFEGPRITAVIDWELAHAGHPLEDLASVLGRGLGSKFGAVAEHIANYERHSGRKVDYAALDYCLVLTLVRWWAGMLIGLSRPAADQNIPVLVSYGQLFRHAMVDALCRLFHQPMVQVEVRLPERPQTSGVLNWCHDVLQSLAQSETASLADRYRLNGVNEMLRFVHSFLDYGPETYEREELERISAVLGKSVTAPGSLSAATLELCAYARQVPSSEAAPLVQFFSWQVQREHRIMAQALGVRAQNVIRYD
jgi:aminoglycoside phosphotransferase (APT) family kinase protein